MGNWFANDMGVRAPTKCGVAVCHASALLGVTLRPSRASALHEIKKQTKYNHSRVDQHIHTQHNWSCRNGTHPVNLPHGGCLMVYNVYWIVPNLKNMACSLSFSPPGLVHTKKKRYFKTRKNKGIEHWDKFVFELLALRFQQKMWNFPQLNIMIS